jgi:DNA polymerase I
MKKEKLAIIDANALIHRGYHALPPLMTKDGVLVNAVYGFANILLKVLKDIKPDYIAVCFDVARKTFRNDMYADYKANREAGPDELYHQFGMVKELVRAFNMPIYAVNGYEADDLIGTIVSKVDSGIQKFIVTGDMDALQLVDKDTSVYTLRKGINDTIIYDEAGVKEKYGFGPEMVVDYKALRGDPSDNIPGVRGVGEKTATDLILKFGAIEELYKKLDDPELKERTVKLLKESKKDAIMSKKLATIKRDVEFEFGLEETKVEPFDAAKLVELFSDWNFKGLIARIPAAEKIITKGQNSLFDKKVEGKKDNFKIRKGYYLIDDEKKYLDFLSKLSSQKEFALDTETDGVDPFNSRLLGISFCWQEGEAYYLTIDKSKDKKFRAIFENDRVKKIGHNIKFDLEVLVMAGYVLNGVHFDTMVASYLLNPGSRQHGLDALAFTEFGYEMTPIEYLIGKKGKDQIDLSQVDLLRVADYSCEDADYTWRLYEKLKKQLLKNNLDTLMERIENPLIPVLAKMESNGVVVDPKFLDKMSGELDTRIKKLESNIFKLSGVEFNIKSPLQLKEVLFDKLAIATAGLARTKTGISTAAAELEKLSGAHPVIDFISEYRELTKLKSTYTDSLPELINKKDSRIHASFNQTVTATGRLSSSNPNLQNIPIRTELGRKIRRGFVAPKGYRIVALDYSQVELRIAAHLSGDKKMIDAFIAKQDFHALTASEVFEVPLSKVKPDMRRKAKEVNFGILYGLGARGLAQRTGSSYEEAIEFIDKYFSVYFDLQEYLENTIALAHAQEYVETLFGRKRYLPEIGASHQQLRAAAERMAVNHSIQGTAADLMKMAMIRVDNLIESKFKNNEVRMILQVHDELVFEIKEGLVKKASEMIRDEMETVEKLKVPVIVDVGIGKNWGESK